MRRAWGNSIRDNILGQRSPPLKLVNPWSLSIVVASNLMVSNPIKGFSEHQMSDSFTVPLFIMTVEKKQVFHVLKNHYGVYDYVSNVLIEKLETGEAVCMKTPGGKHYVQSFQ